jgi:hypothetical protein
MLITAIYLASLHGTALWYGSQPAVRNRVCLQIIVSVPTDELLELFTVNIKIIPFMDG